MTIHERIRDLYAQAEHTGAYSEADSLVRDRNEAVYIAAMAFAEVVRAWYQPPAPSFTCDEADAIVALLSSVDADPVPFLTEHARGDEPGDTHFVTCGICQHAATSHADYQHLAGCSECEDVAQTGGYAPCVTA